MNILYLTSCFNMGGTELYTLDYASEMAQKGHKVFWGTGIKEGKLKEMVDATNVELRECGLGKRTPINMLLSISKIKKLVREENIDVIHAIDAYTAIAVCLAYRKDKQRPKLMWSNGGIHQYSYPIVKKICNNMLDCIIAVSNHVRNTFIEHGYDPYKIKVYFQSQEMRLPTVSRQEWRNKYGIGQDDLVVGSVGRVCTFKGAETLIKIAPALCKDYPHIKFVMVGGGEEKQQFVEMAKEYGVEDFVVFTDVVTDVENAYNAFDIVAFPTYSETRGYVCYEAMFYERPIIASYVGGIPETVFSEYNGLTVPPADLDGWEKAIRRLIGDEALRIKFAENGKAFYDTTLSRESREKTMEDFYNEMLSE